MVQLHEDKLVGIISPFSNWRDPMFRSIALSFILLFGASIPTLAEGLSASELARNCRLLGDPPDQLTQEEANLVLRCVSWWEGYLDRLKAERSQSHTQRSSSVPIADISCPSWRWRKVAWRVRPARPMLPNETEARSLAIGVLDKIVRSVTSK